MSSLWGGDSLAASTCDWSGAHSLSHTPRAKSVHIPPARPCALCHPRYVVHCILPLFLIAFVCRGAAIVNEPSHAVPIKPRPPAHEGQPSDALLYHLQHHNVPLNRSITAAFTPYQRRSAQTHATV